MGKLLIDIVVLLGRVSKRLTRGPGTGPVPTYWPVLPLERASDERAVYIPATFSQAVNERSKKRGRMQVDELFGWISECYMHSSRISERDGRLE